jgi:NAD(P)-dependent dehydrogenase (short-subunit alcohol dehydrogenase family)
MVMKTTQRVWLITGASTGFGRILSEQLLASGHTVVATARKPEQIAELVASYPETALALALDVTDQAAIDAAVTRTIETFGHIDVLINNAGYGIAGAIEEVTEEEYMPVFETNVFGLIRLTRAVLPYMRRQRSGHIVNLSSIAGLVTSPGLGYYNTSKFAVEGFSQALYSEVAPLGIYVTIVEPGPFRTDFLGRSGVKAANRIADYDETAGKTREYFASQDGKQPGDPVKACKAIIEAVESPNPPKHLILGKIAYTRMSANLDQWKEQLEAWREVSLGADFETPAPEGN